MYFIHLNHKNVMMDNNKSFNLSYPQIHSSNNNNGLLYISIYYYYK